MHLFRRRVAPVKTVALLTTVLLTAPLAGASASSPGERRATATPSVEVSAAPVFDEYVALGDSFSAGPLIPLQRLDPLGCLRSTNNYPAFLATFFASDSYVDVTCSGADTQDMRNPQQTIVPGPDAPPQLDALSPSTDLVTVGIGGNDYGLFGEMISECERVREQDPNGAPCKRLFTVDGIDTKKRDARLIQPRVGSVLADIKERSPDAQVVVVGYLRLLPTRGTCEDVPFAKGDYRWGDEVEQVLNAGLRRAATNHGATYINMYPESRGHDACAGRDAWVNGSKIKPLRAANFHPFFKGMRGIARESYRQMTGLPAPDNRLPTPVVPAPPTATLTPAELRKLGEQFDAGGAQ